MFNKQMGMKYKTHRNLVAIPRFKVFSVFFSLVLKTNLLACTFASILFFT